MKTGTGFPIVGIGASAGGVEALEGFFEGISGKPGIAFVVITHLSPDRESQLHQIIQRHTELKVNVAQDGTPVEPDQIYVLPPGGLLTISEGSLHLKKQTASRRERKPIDVFLGSLAKDVGDRAISVVLSGGDGDGALGTKAVKERGGMTLAQIADGHGPDYPDMPQSAISTGYVDFAIPAGEMGSKLQSILRSEEFLEKADGATAEPALQEAAESARVEICAIIRNQIGHDFSGYKARTFLRRVHRRMQVNQIDTLEGYVEKLLQEPQEVNALFRDLLINVTNFFRDADAFDKLAETTIPKLFENRGADDVVRVWVPGCATGEEVFSIAILMREHMDTLRAVPRVQIFATDIDEAALTVARTGRYPEVLLDSVSPERRKRFFVPDGESFVLSKEVRDLCNFSPHSLIRDPPFSRIDLVSCRNLLIYFGPEIQNQVIPTFYYSLRPGGYLFLGTAENTSQFTELFTPLEKKFRIFQRKDDGGRKIQLPINITTGRFRTPTGTRPPLLSPAPWAPVQHIYEAQVLERFAPAHVVVNREGEVVHFSSRTGRFLESPSGAPTRNLLSMARKGLKLDLRALFREAMEKNVSVVHRGLPLEEENGVSMVTITVEPVWSREEEDRLYLVIFESEPAPLSSEAHGIDVGATSGVLHLEQELRELKDRLQSTIEEYETSLEELKSSNEELVSVNEELQSTNEELEASKEELQSMNEELHTVNQELGSKIDALDQANSDLHNLFLSTDIATVFLDGRLRIRSFTPAVAKIFNVIPTDRGRPITDLASKLDVSDLHRDIATALETGESCERDIHDHETSTNYLVKTSAYRSSGGKIDGVVVTFVDVSRLTAAEAKQEVLITELHHRTRNLLAIVQSLASHTMRSSNTLEEFRTEFDGRLGALSRVQSLLSKNESSPITLGHLLKEEFDVLEPSVRESRVQFNGPHVPLPHDIVRTLALALHELVTNAIKHGAFATPSGRLAVDWKLSRSGDRKLLRLEWHETGLMAAPAELPSDGQGFGRYLIERSLPYQFGARTNYRCEDNRVDCIIEIFLPGSPPAGG